MPAENVQVEIVDNSPMDHAIESVAQRAADDRPETRRGELRAAVREPPDEKRNPSSPSRQAGPNGLDADFWTNRLNEMPRFHRNARSRNGARGVESPAAPASGRKHRELRRLIRQENARARRRRRRGVDSREKTKRSKLAQRRRVARADVGKIGATRSMDRNSARSGRISPLRPLDDHRDVRHLRRPESAFGSATLRLDRDVRRYADLGEIDAAQRLDVLRPADIDASGPPRATSRSPCSPARSRALRSRRSESPRIVSHFFASASSRHSAGTTGNCSRWTERCAGIARRPGLLRGEDENRREPDRDASKNMLDRLQGAAAACGSKAVRNRARPCGCRNRRRTGPRS